MSKSDRYHKFQADYNLYLEYKQGNIEAGTILYQKSYDLVYRYAFRYASDSILNFQDVEDVVSQAISEAFSKSSNFLGKSQFSTWVCGIVKIKTLQLFKKKQLIEKYECERLNEMNSYNPVDIAMKKEIFQAVNDAYELLPSISKECIYLVLLFLLGKAKAEVARELQLSNYIFRLRYTKAVEALRLNFMQIYYGMNAVYW